MTSTGAFRYFSLLIIQAISNRLGVLSNQIQACFNAAVRASTVFGHCFCQSLRKPRTFSGESCHTSKDVKAVKPSPALTA